MLIDARFSIEDPRRIIADSKIIPCGATVEDDDYEIDDPRRYVFYTDKRLEGRKFEEPHSDVEFSDYWRMIYICEELKALNAKYEADNTSLKASLAGYANLCESSTEDTDMLHESAPALMPGINGIRPEPVFRFYREMTGLSNHPDIKDADPAKDTDRYGKIELFQVRNEKPLQLVQKAFDEAFLLRSEVRDIDIKANLTYEHVVCLRKEIMDVKDMIKLLFNAVSVK